MTPPRHSVLELLDLSAQIRGMTPDMSPGLSRRHRPTLRRKAKRVTFRLDHNSWVIPRVFESGAPRSTEDLAAQNLSSILENHERLMRILGRVASLFTGDRSSDSGSNKGCASAPLESVGETSANTMAGKVNQRLKHGKYRGQPPKSQTCLAGMLSWPR